MCTHICVCCIQHIGSEHSHGNNKCISDVVSGTASPPSVEGAMSKMFFVWGTSPHEEVSVGPTFPVGSPTNAHRTDTCHCCLTSLGSIGTSPQLCTICNSGWYLCKHLCSVCCVSLCDSGYCADIPRIAAKDHCGSGVFFVDSRLLPSTCKFCMSIPDVIVYHDGSFSLVDACSQCAFTRLSFFEASRYVLHTFECCQ